MNCVICQDTSDDPNWVDTLCGHRFHESCLGGWTAANHDTCPTCRASLATGEPQEVYDDTGGDDGYDGDEGGDQAQGVAPPIGDARCNTVVCNGAARTAYVIVSAGGDATEQYICDSCQGVCDINTDYFLAECSHYAHVPCAA